MAQGRGNVQIVGWNHVGARNSMLLALFVVVVVAVMVQCAQAGTQHVVGGSNQWTDPAILNINSAYLNDWASTQSFAPGDKLSFQYTQGAHNVLEVTATNYNACTTTSPINEWATGDDSVPLNSTGTYYFICGFPSHCAGGQKVAITVTSSSSSSSASPSASPTASASSPSSSSTPSTTPSTSSQSPALASSHPSGSTISSLPASATVVFGAFFVACVSLFW